MKMSKITFLILFILGYGIAQTNSQTTSTSNNLVAQPIPDRTVTFNIADTGISKPIIWGLDLAWLSESNIRRGIAFMGADRVDLVRASFQPTLPLVNGDLQTQQINDLNSRLNLINLTGAKTKVVLNSDHPSVDASYKGNAVNWALLIDATTKRVQARGRTVVTVSPFNEPDYTATGQGNVTDFYNIAGELRKNSRFDSIRISGGNTLNCDQALTWYNNLKSRLDEGNTHQLAGSFDNYANFYTTVRANGHHATNDELHNVMEAMVGVEYGMQTGIWWGTAELARGEFVKASDGMRLGFAEHRPNWTAASVYRNPDGKIQAFGGSSERQAITTTYRFVSKDRDVYYDGYGPQREYTMVMPGGSGYQNGQTNAERVVNITWGDDIQPVIKGRYVLVNRNSGKIMEVAAGSMDSGANVRQNTNIGETYQQWNVTPVDSRIGGDFSYYTFTNVKSSMSLDILNFSLDNSGNIIVWNDSKSGNQQWYLDYAEDGWFYIRSRHSNKCIEVASSGLLGGANIQQYDKTGKKNQQWRFLPVGATVEFEPPVAPLNLVATSNASSIRLNWSSNPEADVIGYTIFRSDSIEGSYNTIARNVNTTSFVDNTIAINKSYFYKIKAVDNSMNSSDYSNEISATTTGNNDLVAHFNFEENTLDSTINLNHCASSGGISYVAGKVGSKAIVFNSSNAFVQLPAYLANHKEISIATWVYWKGTTLLQRIFDFGNDQNQYMFLTPSSSTGKMRFAIKNGGVEQQLNASAALTTGKWSHVAVTLGETGARMYLNGVVVAESNDITISPIDFKPILNYIGRSQFSNPLFNGFIDDFRLYNYALTSNEVNGIFEVLSGVNHIESCTSTLTLSPIPANNVLKVNYSKETNSIPSIISILDLNGNKISTKNFENPNEIEIDVSNIPEGAYLLNLTNREENLIKKLIIKH